MCRIAGIVNPSVPTNELKQMAKEMCAILKNGGPDDEGIYADEDQSLVFGHRRLSIIDTSAGGHQPMSYADGRYHITYNGEIYNYRELREQLKLERFTFKTNSDTEVILAAFAAWGTSAFSMFNGMFAFALLDKHSNELFLVRDACGIKPLYYAITKEGMAFASEVKAFKPVPYLQEKNELSKVLLLAYGHLPEPVTTLQRVQPLAKGSFLQYDIATGCSSVIAFNQYRYTETITSRQEAVALVKYNLREAVKRHMIADAPIGVFLSGGLDSSLIALLASDNYKSQLNTVSVYFEEENFSEKKFQDIVQQNLQGRNCQHLLKEQSFHQRLPEILAIMDQPSCDGINTWFISKYAKQCGLKAVLSGIGGDELFGGYPSFERINASLALEKLPNKLLNAAQYSNSKKLRRLAYLAIKSPVGRYLFLRGQFTPLEIATQLNISQKEVINILEQQPIVNAGIDLLTPKNQASWLEMNMYMQNQLLRDADVMSMAHGVEIRVPFLDKEFMNLALQIKSSVKYSGQNNKQLLVDSFRDILPEAVWNRPKMGFSFPFKKWMQQNAFVKDSMTSNGKKSLENYKQFTSDKMHWSQLMSLLLLQQINY
jgi:asparagine synthase (glutamine-hydrolysing)